MSNYTKGTDFAAKDALSTGNPSKIVKGTEIDDELTAISGAIASKADISSPTFTGAPAAPTASSGTSTTQIATTAFAMGAAALVSPSGEIKMWPTASAPTGFLLCDGSTVSRTLYSDLFTVIGTTFGSGDGSTTFTLPNFENRFPVGAGDLYSVAGTGGSKDAILVSHTHTVTDPGHAHANVVTSSDANARYDGIAGSPVVNQSNDTDTATTGISLSTEGVSATNANLPPYLSVYFIIKT